MPRNFIPIRTRPHLMVILAVCTEILENYLPYAIHILTVLLITIAFIFSVIAHTRTRNNLEERCLLGCYAVWLL
jgi:hypothetical protein